jgi:hypothetical protein
MSKIIAISQRDKDRYGCPNCGCDVSICNNFYGMGALPVTCEECHTKYVILADDLDKSPIGFGTADGKTYYPEVVEHPRKGIPWHPYEWPDPRPDGEGEFCRPRGIGYDLACFVKSKKAGERLLDMVKEVLGNEEPKSWLDYRPREPKWIQFKFQKEEFDLEKLEKQLTDNNRIVTIGILNDCAIKEVSNNEEN